MTVIGYTAGVFDLFHVGHLALLQSAREQCDRLIVGLTTDELSSTYKRKTPIIPYAQRAAILRGLRCVDDVIPQDTMDRYATWQHLRFDVTFVGDDWQGTKLWAQYERDFGKVGIKVVYLPYTHSISSTIVRAALVHSLNPTVDHVPTIDTVKNASRRPF